jgi:hypothetical protein
MPAAMAARRPLATRCCLKGCTLLAIFFHHSACVRAILVDMLSGKQIEIVKERLRTVRMRAFVDRVGQRFGKLYGGDITP